MPAAGREKSGSGKLCEAGLFVFHLLFDAAAQICTATGQERIPISKRPDR
jgi:hypothetical protein